MLNQKKSVNRHFSFFLRFFCNLVIIVVMIKGIDIMNNQNNNTNGVFGSNGRQPENKPINPEIKSEILETTVLPQSGITEGTNNQSTYSQNGQNDKPTLDSILNPSNLEKVNSNPVNTNNDTVVDNSWQTIVSNTPSIDSIPNNMLKEETIAPEVPTPVGVINSNPNFIEPEKNEETVVNPTLVEETLQASPIDESPISSEKVETLNPTTQIPNLEKETPVMETLNPVPNDPPVDDFNAVPVPPVFEEEGKKDKKDGKKVLIVTLIIILIAAIGFGVYTFLSLAKNSAMNSITTKDVKIELGSVLSNNIEDYASITGYNKNDCNLNLNSINVNKVSTYKYTVTCGKETVEGTVIVDDTTKPEVITNDLVLLPTATLKPEDFIAKCLDASKCNYSFQTNITGLTTTIGEHEIEILVSDEYNNQNTVKAKLTISNQAPVKYLTCSKNEGYLDDLQASVTDSYKIGIDEKDNFYNAVRITEFSFDKISNYNQAVTNYKEEVGLHNRVGKTNFYENSKLILIKGNKTLENMNQDLNGRLPNNSNVLRAYLSGLGYSCQ